MLLKLLLDLELAMLMGKLLVLLLRMDLDLYEGKLLSLLLELLKLLLGVLVNLELSKGKLRVLEKLLIGPGNLLAMGLTLSLDLDHDLSLHPEHHNHEHELALRLALELLKLHPAYLHLSLYWWCF